MHTAAAALISWKSGRPTFTAAGLEHYSAACAECHIAFTPESLRSAGDLCKFLRELLQASVAQRACMACSASGVDDTSASMQSLAREALGEVARSPRHSGSHHDDFMQSSGMDESANDARCEKRATR
jgi:hypothetical protein